MQPPKKLSGTQAAYYIVSNADCTALFKKNGINAMLGFNVKSFQKELAHTKTYTQILI